MSEHRALLDRHAVRLGLPEPVPFIDNGCRSADPLPQLERLVEHAVAGHFQVILIPGAWVFCLNDSEADRIRKQLADHGCHILEPARARLGPPGLRQARPALTDLR
ncbi:hypothetical protein [Kitasatospora sp. NPDC050543]|uniref:hypothetical protein n=1 Tax=Kitasatospora sp. NPDC050543 TaxID=3364054 RepID=UPI0037ABA39F